MNVIPPELASRASPQGAGSALGRPGGAPVRIGVAGLGRMNWKARPTFRTDPRVRLVAAADPRDEARARFAEEFGGRAYATVDELVRDADVEAVYVATPHQHHVAHVALAARAGKHVLCEKPMALTVAHAQACG